MAEIQRPISSILCRRGIRGLAFFVIPLVIHILATRGRAADCSLQTDFPSSVEACQHFTVHITNQLNGTFDNIGYKFNPYAGGSGGWNLYTNTFGYSYSTPGTYQWSIWLWANYPPVYYCHAQGTVTVAPTPCTVASCNTVVPGVSERWVGVEATASATSSGCGSSGLYYQWLWGDGSSAEYGSPVNHTFQENGSFQWKMIAYSGNNCAGRCEENGTIVIGDVDDLVGDHIETVQTLRDGTDQLPLVAGKSTVVRVFPRVDGKTPEPIPNVTGTLRAYRDGTELSGSPLQPTNPNITAYGTPDPQQLNHSLNFTLPTEWSATGEMVLEAEVLAGSKDIDPNNNKMVKCVPFETRVLQVRYVLYTNEALPALPPVDPRRAEAAATLLKQLYPASVFYGAWDQTIRSMPPKPAGWLDEDNLMPDNWYGYQMSVLMNEISPWARPDVLVGFLPANKDDGRAYVKVTETSEKKKRMHPQAVAVIELSQNSSANDQFLMCHEVGHLYHLVHPGFNTGNWVNCLLTPKHIEDRVVNGNGRLALRSLNVDDSEMMNTGRNDMNFWISQFSWTNLFAAFREPPELHRVEITSLQQSTVQVRGWIRSSGAGGLEYSYPALSTSGDEKDGPCTIRFEGAAGQLVAETRFTVSTLDSYGQVVDQGFFVVTPPRPPIFSSMALTMNGQVLARRQVSAHAPVVRFTSPGSGEPLATNGTVRWTASDADGDALRYLLSYSPDDRATWIPLAFDLENPHFAFDTSLVPGGAQFWLRVVASDGLNFGTAEGGPFVVADKGPIPLILSPSSNQVCGAWMPLMLRGEAYDLEEGGITGSNLVWTSDIAGVLGTGGTVHVEYLSSGTHWITLRATDSQGVAGRAQIQIRAVVGAHIDCESGAVDLGPVRVGQPRQFILNLRNQGGNSLNVNEISTNDPQFHVLVSNFPLIIGPGSSADLPVRFTPITNGPQSGTLTILSNDREQYPYLVSLTGFGASALEVWRQERFGAFDGTGQRADDADPDGDRLKNIVEFAFGVDPRQFDPDSLLCPVVTGNTLTVSFQQPAGVDGITYQAESSSDLSAVNWHSLADTGTNRMHIFRKPIGSYPAQFLRLKVSKP